MKRLVILVMLAACGSDGDQGVATDAPIDVHQDGFGCIAPDQRPSDCDEGEKCTWLTVQETPELLGDLGCAPIGAVPLGGACTRGPAGYATGYDDCIAGAICVDGSCRDICDFDGAYPCDVGAACVEAPGVFTNGDDAPAYGVCPAPAGR